MNQTKRSKSDIEAEFFARISQRGSAQIAVDEILQDLPVGMFPVVVPGPSLKQEERWEMLKLAPTAHTNIYQCVTVTAKKIREARK